MAGTAWWPMGKYFFKQDERHDDYVVLAGQTAHHLINVMRIRIGHEILLCDGMNTDFIAKVRSINEKPPSITLALLSQSPSNSETTFPITLYQGLPKGDKMEWIIEKAIECGACKIVPVCTSRSVPKLSDPHKNAKKTDRFSRIAEAAAAQSMRGIIPPVLPNQSFTSALKDANNNMCLVAYENEHTTTINSALGKLTPKPIAIWIGPEGGFDDSEIQALTNMGAITVSLGPRILRTETAGIVALSQILCVWDK